MATVNVHNYYWSCEVVTNDHHLLEYFGWQNKTICTKLFAQFADDTRHLKDVWSVETADILQVYVDIQLVFFYNNIFMISRCRDLTTFHPPFEKHSHQHVNMVNG